jgi:hypothetical protein
MSEQLQLLPNPVTVEFDGEQHTLSAQLTNDLPITLYDNEWLKKNHLKLADLFPETWTHMQNLNMLAIGYHLKLLGVDWRNSFELGVCMSALKQHGGIFEHSRENVNLVRRVP